MGSCKFSIYDIDITYVTVQLQTFPTWGFINFLSQSVYGLGTYSITKWRSKRRVVVVGLHLHWITVNEGWQLSFFFVLIFFCNLRRGIDWWCLQLQAQKILFFYATNSDMSRAVKGLKIEMKISPPSFFSDVQSGAVATALTDGYKA